MESVTENIEVDKEIISSEPSLQGNNAAVKALFDYLEQGSIEEFLKSHPAVTREHAIAILKNACTKVQEQTVTYFENIREEIIKRIEAANDSVKVAVCWFTKEEIADALLKKANTCSIEIIVSNNFINWCFSEFKYQDLQQAGIKIYLSDEKQLMHNKYCIVDDRLLITGSYNWTKRAEENNENVIVTNDAVLVKAYADNFNELLVGKKSVSNFDEEVNKSKVLNPLLFAEYVPIIHNQVIELSQQALVEANSVRDEQKKAEDLTTSRTQSMAASDLPLPNNSPVWVCYDEKVIPFRKGLYDYPVEIQLSFKGVDREKINFFEGSPWHFKAKHLKPITIYLNQCPGPGLYKLERTDSYSIKLLFFNKESGDWTFLWYHSC